MARRYASRVASPRLSQHFLRSARLAAQLADAAGITAGDHVLDVGAGRGILTQALAARHAHVTAVEIDATLAARLQARWESNAAVTVCHEDFLSMTLPATPFSVVANLPFQHTSAIMRTLLDDPAVPLRSAALIVEWGYACGMTSPADPTREAIGWTPWFVMTLVRHLAPAVFDPPPRVAAAVVGIARRPVPLVPAENAHAYHQTLRQTFRNGTVPLKHQLAGRLSARRWTRLCDEMAIPHSARPGDLDAWQWAALYRAVAGLDRE